MGSSASCPVFARVIHCNVLVSASCAGACAVGAKVPADLRVLEIFSSTFRADQARLALERPLESADVNCARQHWAAHWLHALSAITVLQHLLAS
jgi:hypothetical protein